MYRAVVFNHELNTLIGAANIMRCLEAQTLKWWGPFT
jgi:hypothetical protein